MKSPREIILDRHRSADAKLDGVRRNALETAFPRAVEHSSSAAGTLPLRVAAVLWRQLILPCRGFWAGLAAVWAIIIVLNLTGGQKSVQMARYSSPPDNAALAVLREQRELLSQLLEPPAPTPADRPKTTAPRGEIFQTVTFC